MDETSKQNNPQIEQARMTVDTAFSKLSPQDRGALFQGLLGKYLTDFDDVTLNTINRTVGDEQQRRIEQDQTTPLQTDNTQGQVEDVTETSKLNLGVFDDTTQQLDHTRVALATEEHPTEEVVEEKETSDQKAERLLQNVDKAEFASFQEYNYAAQRDGTGFIVNKVKSREGANQTDLVSTNDYSGWERASSIVHALEDEFGVPKSSYNSRSSRELFCLVKNINGKVVIQGGGNTHLDFGNRSDNSSAFKLEFNNPDAAEEFLQWMQENPQDSLSHVMERAIGQYTNEGKFQYTLLPQEIVANTFEFKSPFAMPIKELRIRRLDTNKESRKNYNGTDIFEKAEKEWSDAWKTFNENERIKREKERSDRSLKVTPQVKDQSPKHVTNVAPPKKKRFVIF